MGWGALALGLCLTGFYTSASAQSEPILLTEAEHANWKAIGRVNRAGYKSQQMCTGTLIAPDTVLTAAHCLTDMANGTALPAGEMRFVPGWYRGTYAAIGVGSEIRVPLDFLDGVREARVAVPWDIAVLKLQAPIAEVSPISIADLAQGPYRILGYRWDRPHALSDSLSCPVAGPETVVLPLSCQVTFGTSGAPVLEQRDGAWRVAGVVSAKAEGRTLAVPLDGRRLEELDLSANAVPMEEAPSGSASKP